MEWLKLIFNVWKNVSGLLEGWRVEFIVFLYKGKGEKGCVNYRRSSLLSIPGEVYMMVITERGMANTENQLGDEQGSFSKGGRVMARFSD